jgi:putative 4-mercaptohistidine N1-methyltranferase
MAGQEKRKALDLGCAVGRTAFDLGRVFDQVVGIDLSERFVEAAATLQKDGAIDFFRRDEGELGNRVTLSLEALDLSRAAQKVSFATGDALNLSDEHNGYDLIFAGNLIDRLMDPALFLRGIHQRLSESGTLVISSPYTLLEDFTPRANWIGGFELNGQPRTVLDGVRELLSDHFEEIQEPRDVPFVIRETRRKYQHTIAELSSWRRIR